MDNERVSVIIATFNRERPLIDTLGDVLQLEYPDLEIIVVDQTKQHEADTARQLAQWHSLGKIRWLHGVPPGLTAARNVGWRASSGRYVIYVDDDVRIFNPAFVHAHVRELRRPGVGAVAGRVLEPDRPPLTVASRIGDLGFCGHREPGFGSAVAGPAATVRGCNMSFRREALEAVGGFDESYTRSAFREDTDISFRLRRRRFALWFAPEAWLYHLSADAGGTRDQSILVDTDLIRNDVRFAGKNLGWGRRLAWQARCYLSRVLRDGLLHGKFRLRHQAFFDALSQN